MNAVSLWLSPDDLGLDHHLGVCLSLGFEQQRFLLSPAKQTSHELAAGELLLAVISDVPATDLRAPDPQRLLREKVFVLRVSALERLPDENTREALTCHNLLQASLPQGVAWDSPEHVRGVLECDVLGSYSAPEPGQSRPVFSAHVTIGFTSAHLHLYWPSTSIMEMMVNGTLSQFSQLELGVFRSGEDQGYRRSMHPARISMADIRGKRTAMFGKTRLGKSNVVKLVAQGMLDATVVNPNVGQLIFDVNGEYANINPQDGDTALAQVYQSRCICYFLTENRSDPNARLLRFNFYQRSDEALEVISEILSDDVTDGPELRNLFTCRLPKLVKLSNMNEIEFRRITRKWMLFWALLDALGCEHNSDRMKAWLLEKGLAAPFNPGFSQTTRSSAYMEVMNKPAPSMPFDFPSMILEMRVVARFARMFRNDPSLNPHGQYIFDSDETVMIEILCGSGHAIDLLRPCMPFHSPSVGNFTQEILLALDESKTVIVNFSSAGEKLLRYFARSICTSLFQEQERKFVTNSLNNQFVQVYFEEAHNIFPPQGSPGLSIYSRFAKEGAKFNIGIVYCTQSPSTVNKDLLAQTENFFIGHLSCSSEAAYLSDVQVAFQGSEKHILHNRTPGYMLVLTYSHRYVVPVQAHFYSGEVRMRTDDSGGRVPELKALDQANQV
jgi:hypothetical protein